MKILLTLFVLFFSTSVFAIDEMDGMGDWSCKEWLKLNDILKSESGIITMQDMTLQWLSGFMSGVNIVSVVETGEYMELSTLMKNKDALFSELVMFCEENHKKLVVEFVIDKMPELKIVK